jgi:hypothetical protein
VPKEEKTLLACDVLLLNKHVPGIIETVPLHCTAVLDRSSMTMVAGFTRRVDAGTEIADGRFMRKGDP